jgi:hypothetical protein
MKQSTQKSGKQLLFLHSEQFSKSQALPRTNKKSGCCQPGALPNAEAFNMVYISQRSPALFALPQSTEDERGLQPPLLNEPTVSQL